MSKIYVSSDLHFNHRRIIEFCPNSRGHCNSTEHMNEVIINNFNSVIMPEDTLYLLGDIGFGQVEAAVELIARLNGRKIWIHGNHDRKFWNNPYYHENKSRMGVAQDTPYKTIHHTVDGVKQMVVMFHFPIENWESRSNGSIHIHGHLHSGSDQMIIQRRMDVGVDGNGLMPYLLDDVINRLVKFPVPREDYHAS
jgi:calcineurin-like phosphoesterase family protein